MDISFPWDKNSRQSWNRLCASLSGQQVGSAGNGSPDRMNVSGGTQASHDFGASITASSTTGEYIQSMNGETTTGNRGNYKDE